MSTLMRNTGSLALDQERERLIPVKRTGTALVSAPDAAARAALLARGYSGIEEHSTPFHAFLEHATTFLFPVLLVASLYFSLSQLHELELLWLALLALPLSLVLGDLGAIDATVDHPVAFLCVWGKLVAGHRDRLAVRIVRERVEQVLEGDIGVPARDGLAIGDGQDDFDGGGKHQLGRWLTVIPLQ